MRVILLTLGLLALIIAALILLGLFLIWYVEYRGLGGTLCRAAGLCSTGHLRGAGWACISTLRRPPDERRRYLVGAVARRSSSR